MEQTECCKTSAQKIQAPGNHPIERIQHSQHSENLKSSKIHELIYSIWNKEELPEEWKGSIVVPFFKKGDEADCSNYRDIQLFVSCVQSFIQHPVVKGNSICRGSYWGSSVWIVT